MTDEEKKLLTKELSERLPHKVMILVDTDREFDGGSVGILGGVTPYVGKNGIEEPVFYQDHCLTPLLVEEIKPYLRRMSSMTDEEKKEMHELLSPEGTAEYKHDGISTPVSHYGDFIPYEYMDRVIDWLRARHFDIRGLIDKGLAIDVDKEEFNPYKK